MLSHGPISKLAKKTRAISSANFAARNAQPRNPCGSPPRAPGTPIDNTNAPPAIAAWLATGLSHTAACTLRDSHIAPAAHAAAPASAAKSRSQRSAIIEWTIRTLLRSRQHRILVAFYAGIGFAAIVLFLETKVVQVMTRVASPTNLSLPLIAASIVMTLCWILGIRSAFNIPIELRANWIFRLTLTNGPAEPRAATQASLLTTGLIPILAVAAPVFLYLGPWPQAASHLLILSLLALTIAALTLRSFQAIRFTRAYLPGTSHIHITMALCLMLGLNTLFWAANYERQSLTDPRRFLVILTALTLTAALAWYRLHHSTHPDALSFDDIPEPAVLTLNLHRDGLNSP